MAEFKKISINEQSLAYLLNLVLNNVREERNIAMINYNNLTGLTTGSDVAEILMLSKDISESINGFLNSANKSTEQILKMAKVISDYMLKAQDNDLISDEDRMDIENLVKSANEEIEKNNGIIGRIG